MSSLAQPVNPARRRAPMVLRILALAAATVVLLATALAVSRDTANAHGSTINPASRNYGCWKRWGSDFQNPAMATQDPMCWQAWQADPNAMWNWNGLYREGVNGNHQAAVPSGQLCSAGETGGVRYAALDNPGNWQAANVGTNFNVTMHDQALHGADYFLIYVTRQGFNPLTQRLGWNNLELVRETGRYAPGEGTRETGDPVLNGVSVTIPVSAPGRSGRHIVYVIWKASHADQNYYWCSDVNFGGSGGNPQPTATPTPTRTTPPPTSEPTRTPPAGGSGGCSAAYTVTGTWSGGFQADVRVTAGSTAISGWTVTWTFANGQQVSNSWGATVTTSGASVTARNTGYNGSLAAGASASFGFLGSQTGSNAVPTLSCAAA
ncbi:lytic polysaccharide monooxygenase [Plantactinospora sp. KLBMP9567]|uniref:lytic polysaccharide monooxygenase auxiliary activity family 9 protein n=1 Tax=Plantactinospora sp. KLBMP9567 TaxID=3085900 RepID=UPI002981981A|nr:lytic polysaccharide monooxygenase [Plantactinospora sp. KLBMP9567]MDW5322562.1 lytic polysaccharide monooxygenase [Plantactinospora sp. KLBMP9567]